MAVVLRLTRRGAKHRPFYKIVATCSKRKRDGGHIDELGIYDPLGSTQLTVEAEKVLKWLNCGAKPSSTVQKLLKRAGIQGRQLTASSSGATA